MLGYILITVIITYPVTFKLGSAVAGIYRTDAFECTWWMWWTKKSLVDLQISPANFAFNNLPLEVHNPIVLVESLCAWIGIPLVAIGGPVLAYNVLFLLTFILTSLTTYLLCYELTGNRLASFVGGLVFAFCPNRVFHAASGHFPFINTYWFPLYALFLIKLFKQPTTRNGLLCGLFLAFALLVNLMHIAYLIALFTIVFCLFQYWTNRAQFRNWQLIKSGGLALLLAALLVLPFYGSALSLLLMSKDGLGGLEFLTEGGTIKFSADPLLFFIPSPFHPLLGRIEPLYALGLLYRRSGFTEGIVYWGIVPLLLTGVGIRSRSRELKLFVVLGLIATVLSLGPFLKFGGELVQYTIENETSYVILPYALIKKLPLVGWGRTPSRLVLTTMFSLAVLSSYGVADILTRFRDSKVKSFIGAMFALLILFEYILFFPFPVGGEYIPSFYHDIAKDPSDFVVLDIPINRYRLEGLAMYYQTVHGHRAVRGHLYRYPPNVENMLQYMRYLVVPTSDSDIFNVPSDIERPRSLALHNIKYVILHKPLCKGNEEEQYTVFLTRAFGNQVYEDSEISVFSVPALGLDAADEIPWIKLGANWHDLEFPEGESPLRWMSNDGQIEVYKLTPAKVRLRFAAYPFYNPRHLQVLVNGQDVGTIEISEWGIYITEGFTLQRGWNTVVFKVVEGCDRPVDIPGAGGDARCLSILFQDMSFVPTD